MMSDKKPVDPVRQELRDRIWATTGDVRELWVREYLLRYLWPKGTPGISPMFQAARKQRLKRLPRSSLGLKVVRGGRYDE